MVTRYNSLKQKKKIKKLKVSKVNSTPDLMKASEHVILSDAEAVSKYLKAATSIQ